MAQDIGVAYVHVEPSGQGFGKSIEGSINDAVGKASRKSSSNLMSKLGGAFGKIGKAGTATIAGLATGITVLAAKGGFERALNIENAQAKLKGLGHDSNSVAEIMNDALASVKGTAFGLGDAATVAASLSASGVAEGTQLTEVLKTVADTAQISGRSLTDIGTIFGSVAARGKLQGDDMLQLMSSGIPVLQMLGKHLGKTSADVSDMVSKGKIDFQTFADAMKEGLGGAALSAGDTFTGALSNVKAALSRLGETAATPLLNGLRGLFNQAIPLIDSFTATVKPTLEKVGASLQSGLENAIPTIQAKLKSLGDTIGSIPGLQMLASAAVSLKAQLAGLAGALISLVSGLNAGGRASSACSTLVSALGGTLASMTQALSNAVGWAKEFVNRLAASDSLRPFLESLLDIATSLAGLASALTQTVQHMLGFDNSAATASDMAQRFSTVLDTLAGVIRPVGEWIRGLGQWAQSNGALIAAALKTIAAAFLAMKGWQAITSGVQAVTGGLKAITTMAGGITKTATAAFDLIGGISDAGSMAGALSKLAGSFNVVKAAQAAWTAITKAATAVQLAFNLAMDANPIMLIVTAIGAVVAALTLFFTQTKTGRNMWSQFVSWFTGVWESIGTVCQPVLTAIGTSITQTMTQLQQIWQTAWTLIGTIVQNVWNVIGPTVTAAIQQIQTNIQTFIAIVTPILQAGMQVIQTIFQTAVAVVGPIWNGFWNVLGTVVQSAWSIVTTLVSTALAVIQGIIQTVLDIVNGNWDAVWADIQNVASTVWNGICSIVSTCVSLLRGVISTVCSTISNIWNTLWNGAKSIVSTVWSGITSTVNNAVSSLVSSVQGIGGKVKSALSDAGNWLKSAGRKVIDGLWKGISGAIGGLYDNIKNAMSGLVDKAKNALGIHSPSRVFRDEVGIMVGKGMALGIDDSTNLINRSMDSLTSTMRLDDLSKTNRTNTTTQQQQETNQLLQTTNNKLDILTKTITAALADDRPFTQRDLARLVRSMT